jgi:hypothetical protein
MSYTDEKFYMAIRALAIGDGRIKDRLFNAYIYHLNGRHLQIPEEWQAEFENIIVELTMVKPKGTEGSVKASLELMTDDRATEIADRLLSMFLEIHEMYLSKQT